MIKLGKNILIKMVSVATAIVLLAAMLPAGNAKAAKVDLSKKGSLTVYHTSVDKEPLAGVKSHIYRVASIDAAGVYTILNDYEAAFDDKDFFNNNYDFDAWKSCVDKLKDHVKTNKIKAYRDGTSDAKGSTYYTDLDLGVYLVLTDTYTDSKYVHTFSDFVYPVPLLAMDTSKGVLDWHYEVTVSPKKTRADRIIDDEFVVLKRWADSNSSTRPNEIKVAIYRDSELYKNITLSSSNNWQYSWTYEPGHEWKLVETSTGKNYKPSLSTNRNENKYTFVFTNTYDPPRTPPEPDPPTPETPEEPTLPDLPTVLGAIRDLPQVLGARRLPQTGQLWWPLPVLVLAGVLFIIKGIRKNSKNA